MSVVSHGHGGCVNLLHKRCKLLQRCVVYFTIIYLIYFILRTLVYIFNCFCNCKTSLSSYLLVICKLFTNKSSQYSLYGLFYRILMVKCENTDHFFFHVTMTNNIFHISLSLKVYDEYLTCNQVYIAFYLTITDDLKFLRMLVR